MALTGSLSALSPTELFQLISLTKKSGQLVLRRGARQGIVVFRNGRVVFAASDSLRSTLGSTLAQGRVGADQVFIKEAGQPSHPADSDSGSFIVEVRPARPGVLEEVIRDQIESVARELLRWRSGEFIFEALDLPENEDLGVETGWLQTGVDSAALLLRTLTKLDEAERDRWEHDLGSAASGQDDPWEGLTDQTDISAAFEVLVDESTGEITWAPLPGFAKEPTRDLKGLRSIMGEVNEMRGMSPSLTAEVALLILRYAAQVLQRGVLLAVRRDRVLGIGQFGLELEDGSADERVRSLAIPLDAPSLFRDVVRNRSTYRGVIPETEWNSYFIDSLGGATPKAAVVVPLVIDRDVVALLYGDNLPLRIEVGAVDGLEILMCELGLAVENARLERRLRVLEQSANPGPGQA